MLRVPIALALASIVAGSYAMVGSAPPAGEAVARRVALLVGSRGNFCTGVALARDLVLTAAHCVLPGADYKLLEYDAERQPLLRDVALIARHPQFDLKVLLAHRATADLALLKLARPANLVPASLVQAQQPVAVGDRFLVAGFGVAVRDDGRTGGTVRAATLVATGQPGSLQIRLVDPDATGAGGLGACTGDSGAPVFLPSTPLSVVGVVSWSTGPGMTAGCGGLTGVTPGRALSRLDRGTGLAAGQPVAIGSP